MRKHLATFTIFITIFAGGMSVKPIAAAEGSDQSSALEQRIQNLEKQLGELKGLLEEQKKAAPIPATAVIAPASPAAKAPAGPTLVGPPGKIQIGGDIRWRGRYFDNLFDFTDTRNDQSQTFRFRPRVFIDWKPTDEFEVYTRFTKEWLWGGDPEWSTSGLAGSYGGTYDVEAKDVIFDNAWAEYKNILGSGLSIRIGRQDFMDPTGKPLYGEGFILMDGTPQDGSQTFAFDAVRLSYAHDWGTTDLLYAKMFEYNPYIADDEDVYGIYNKWNISDFGLEPYFLVRNKRNKPYVYTVSSSVPATGTNDPNNPGEKTLPTTATYTSLSMIDPSPQEKTFLLGMRTTRSFEIADGVKLALAAEGGKEWGTVNFTGMGKFETDYSSLKFKHSGDYNKVDRDAWGGYLHGTLSFDKVTWKPSIKAGISYMSGDDPNTKDYEGWDDFYAEWPKYSELYIYSIYDGFKGRTGLNDPDIGAWSNMYIPEVVLSVKPTDKLTESLRYLYFGAMEGNSLLSGGKDRGHNLQWLQEYVFTKNLSGHVLVEWFKPGDFYKTAKTVTNPNPSNPDDAWFARFQLMYKF